MLKKENRLRGKKNFKLILKKGEVFLTQNLVLRLLNVGTNEIKFGFIVSTKISKRATKRNKIKRWLREITRQEIEKLKGGFWGILAPKKEVLNLDFWELKKEVKEILKKAKLYG